MGNSTTYYRHAPLIELIVEVRWPISEPSNGNPTVVTGSSPYFDNWFHELTNRLASEGLTVLERLTPHDMPSFAHQPVFRYSLATEELFPKCQFGHGVFTINIGPPNYRSWKSFRAQIQSYLNSLCASMPDGAPFRGFNHASLRYIDVFTGELRARQAHFPFTKEKLGVVIELPKGLLEHAKSEDEINSTIALGIPIKGKPGTELRFQLAAGRRNQDDSVDTIMDMTYSCSREYPLLTSPVEAILGSLDEGHNTVHNWFEILTEKIQDRMGPVAQSD